MNKIIVLTFALLLSLNSYAGWKHKAILGGGAFILYKSIPTLLKKGGPFAMKKAKSIVSKYVKKNPENANVATIFLTSLAIENSKMTNKSIEVLIDTGLINKSEKDKIVEDSKNFQKAYSMVEANIKNINEKEKCANGYELKALAHENLEHFMSENNKPVQLFDVGSYILLKKNEKTGDNMEHDHIPSTKSVIKYTQKKLSKEYNPRNSLAKNIEKNASSIEIPHNLHKNGRTYKGRNTKLKISLDSKNLKKATLKDMAYHFMNSGFNIKLLNPFKKLYIRNSSLCLYR